MFRSPRIHLCCALLLGLSACSGGGSNEPTGAATPGVDPTGMDEGVGDGVSDGAGAVTDALSHPGTAIAAGPAPSENDPLLSTVGRERASALTAPLGVIIEVVENHSADTGESCKALGAEYASCSVINLHIKDANGVLNNADWKLYFHSVRRLLRVDSDQFNAVLVNGDLNYLSPSDNFTPFAGGVATIKMITEFNYLMETDFMPRYWLVRGNGAAELLANTDSETDENAYAVEITGNNRKAWDTEPNPLATAKTRFDNNKNLTTSALNLTPADVQLRIIPRPTSIEVDGAGALSIAGGLNFSAGDLSAASAAAVQARATQIVGAGRSQTVRTRLQTDMDANSYRVEISATGIDISGPTDTDLFYGAQTVLALVQPGSSTIPHAVIEDSPRFTFRGMHVDVARNFHSVNTVRRLIDQMAAYKMNKLHLHLTDDEGWRLEIPGLAELTSVSGKRQFELDAKGQVTERNGLMPQLGSGPNSSNQGSGFFTRAQFIELLQYAAARHIEVIPEFDMPAHARAAVVAMRARAANLGNPNDVNVRIDDPADTSRYLTVQHYDDGIINPCVPGTYAFLNTVITEVSAMYAAAGLQLSIFHMGGDEAKNVFKGPGFEDLSAGGATPWQGDIDTSAYDFPWERSPACASFIENTAGINNRTDLTPYFIQRVSQLVADAGIPALYAYQDIYREESANGNYEVKPSDLATTRAGVGFWEVVWSGGYNSANLFSSLGYETIIAVPDYLYFDFPYEVDPKERGYYWATRYTDTQKVFSFAPQNLPQNAETSVDRDGNTWSATGAGSNDGFVGMQGQLWSETVRTPEQFDYMVFPRLLALAERAWHRASWELDYQAGVTYSATTGLVNKTALEQDFASFARALAIKELPKLDAAGINYRIPVPGAENAAGTLQMNVGLPGLPLEYSTDGSRFTRYDAANAPDNASHVRALSANGARAGRAIEVNAQ